MKYLDQHFANDVSTTPAINITTIKSIAYTACASFYSLRYGVNAQTIKKPSVLAIELIRPQETSSLTPVAW